MASEPATPPQMSTSRIMLASALAGAFARVPTHPLDTLKARIQAASPPPSLPTALQSLLRAEGVRGLYRGFAFTFAVSVPASCMYFTTYELSKGPSAASHFAAGMLAETVSCVLWVPCDVIKERMQVQAFSTRAGGYGEYASGWGALRHIARSEGVRGLYKGYWATLASFGPMSATYFMFYEQLRARLVRRVGGDAAAVPHAQFWLAGGLAGGAAAWITTPLDLVKLRMQVHASAFRYAGVLSGLRSVAGNEGARALWRGAVPRTCFVAASSSVSMALFEAFKALQYG